MAGNLATGFERARVISGEHGGAQGCQVRHGSGLGRGPMLIPRSLPNLACRVGVHCCDPEPHDQVRPGRAPQEGCNQPSQDDCDVRKGIVAGREKRGSREATAAVPVAGQQIRAGL